MSEKQEVPNIVKRDVLDQLYQQYAASMYAAEVRMQVQARLTKIGQEDERLVEGVKKDMERSQVGMDVVLELLKEIPLIKAEAVDGEEG